MKIPRVTRTMKGSVVTVKAVDRQNSIMFDRTYSLPRFHKTEAKVMKAVQSKLSKENPDYLVLRVVENVPKKFFCEMLEDKYFEESDKTIID